MKEAHTHTHTHTHIKQPNYLRQNQKWSWISRFSKAEIREHYLQFAYKNFCMCLTIVQLNGAFYWNRSSEIDFSCNNSQKKFKFSDVVSKLWKRTVILYCSSEDMEEDNNILFKSLSFFFFFHFFLWEKKLFLWESLSTSKPLEIIFLAWLLDSVTNGFEIFIIPLRW